MDSLWYFCEHALQSRFSLDRLAQNPGAFFIVGDFNLHVNENGASGVDDMNVGNVTSMPTEISDHYTVPCTINTHTEELQTEEENVT